MREGSFKTALRLLAILLASTALMAGAVAQDVTFVQAEGDELTCETSSVDSTSTPNKTLTLRMEPEQVLYKVQGMGGNYVFGGVTGAVAQYTLSHVSFTYARTQMLLQDFEDFSNAADPDAGAAQAVDAADVEGSNFRKTMAIERVLAKRKIPSIISVWRVPAWMRGKALQGNGERVPPDKYPDLAAAVGQYLLHLRDEYGCEPVAFSFNEPDMGVHLKFTAEEHRDVIKCVGAHLEKLGLKTRMVLGDLVHPAHSVKYLRPAVADEEALRYVGVLSFHSWGERTRRRSLAKTQSLKAPICRPNRNRGIFAKDFKGERIMQNPTRITFDPNVMGGKPCLRGLRVTVGTIVGLLGAGYSNADILKAYPYLEEEDIREALAYAAWRAEEIDLPLVTP